MMVNVDLVNLSALMDEEVRGFQARLNILFREFILGMAFYEVGVTYLTSSDPKNSISLRLSGECVTEPVYLRELHNQRLAVKHGLAELFQAKAIAAWSDLLSDIFAVCVSLHFSGTKPCPELKSKSASFDFRSSISLEEQIKEGLIKDFKFSDYKTKITTVQKLIPLDRLKNQLFLIQKHVEIRNSGQHHGGRMHGGGLKNLGLEVIEILGDAGDRIQIREGELVSLSIVEVDILKSALFEVSSNFLELP